MIKKILIFIIITIFFGTTICSDQNIHFKKYYNIININKLIAGDMIITNATPFWGVAGHTAIVLNNNEVMHIPNPLSNVSIIPTKKFINLHRNGTIRVFRLNNLDKAKNAARWVLANYKKSNAKYKLTMNLSTIDETYCSKLIWQAYYYGVGSDIVSPAMRNMMYGLRLPYSLPAMFSRGEYKMEYVGLL